jgi:hypothetical protein
MIPDYVRCLSQIICLLFLITTISAADKNPADKRGRENRIGSVLLNLHKTLLLVM